MKSIHFKQPEPKEVQDNPIKSDANRYWRKFRNVYKSVRFFQSPVTKQIISPNEISLQDVQGRSVQLNKGFSHAQFQAHQHANQDLSDAMNLIRMRRELFMLVEKGQNINAIKQVLESDPNKYIYEPMNSKRLVNQKNEYGLTPLYIAARNGHENICQLLINYGANPNVIIEQQDCVLAVAIRWKHNTIMNLLLRNENIERRIIQMSLQYCDQYQKMELQKRLENI